MHLGARATLQKMSALVPSLLIFPFFFFFLPSFDLFGDSMVLCLLVKQLACMK